MWVCASPGPRRRVKASEGPAGKICLRAVRGSTCPIWLRFFARPGRMWFFDPLKCAPMDVRKLVVALCVVTLVAVAIVLFLQRDVAETGRPPNNPAIAEHVETRHGPAMRAIGVRSLGVDRKSGDVVVVFAGGGRLGRRVAGRVPGLAGVDGCGELDVGIAVGESLTAWGDARTPDFRSRLDCVIEKVLEQAADLRGGD